MTEQEKAEQEKAATLAAEQKAETQANAEQDPLKNELNRVQSIKKPEIRTEKEKAEYTLKKNAERVKELGGDPTLVLGVASEELEDDEKPMTVGQFKKFQQDNASRSALQLADSIESETERELVKFHIQNTIRPTGNPNEDLRLARTLTNAAKNAKIMEESNRKVAPKTYSSGGSADAKYDPVGSQELTKAEQRFLLKPYKMTKEQIIKARQPVKQRSAED